MYRLGVKILGSLPLRVLKSKLITAKGLVSPTGVKDFKMTGNLTIVRTGTSYSNHSHKKRLGFPFKVSFKISKKKHPGHFHMEFLFQIQMPSSQIYEI